MMVTLGFYGSSNCQYFIDLLSSGSAIDVVSLKALLRKKLEREVGNPWLVKCLLSLWLNNSLFSRDAFVILIAYFDYLQSPSKWHSINPEAYEY